MGEGGLGPSGARSWTRAAPSPLPSPPRANGSCSADCAHCRLSRALLAGFLASMWASVPLLRPGESAFWCAIPHPFFLPPAPSELGVCVFAGEGTQALRANFHIPAQPGLGVT